jgi:hypothetical protein
MNEDFNPIEDEYRIAHTLFDFNDFFELQKNHEIQIIKGEDYQYYCYIDRVVYATGLTMIFALSYGIKKFKEHTETKK